MKQERQMGRKVMSFQIAIDGPAGAGKSTIARRVAEELKFIYVDTGAMYRAMALFFIRNNIKPDETKQMSKKCREADIRITYADGQQVVLLNGENVNALIRTGEVTAMSSISSTNPDVREKMVRLQQQLAEAESVVMDGRDIGTCVLPAAQMKIYLTAAIETRARRRVRELEKNGTPADYEKIKEEIRERDERDMTRDIAPLKKAADAIEVDTSAMTPAEVVDRVLSVYSDIIQQAEERDR